jgi:hypothetical protein
MKSDHPGAAAEVTAHGQRHRALKKIAGALGKSASEVASGPLDPQKEKREADYASLVKKDQPKAVEVTKPALSPAAEELGRTQEQIAIFRGKKNALTQTISTAATKDAKAVLTGKPFSNVNTTTAMSDLMKEIG